MVRDRAGSAGRSAVRGLLLPPRIWSEAVAVQLSSRLQTGFDIHVTAATSVVHGASANLRKAGAEAHGTVKQLCVRHHTFAQAGHALIQHGQNESIETVFWGCDNIFALIGFIVFPAVQTLAGFSSQLTV